MCPQWPWLVRAEVFESGPVVNLELSLPFSCSEAKCALTLTSDVCSGREVSGYFRLRSARDSFSR